MDPTPYFIMGALTGCGFTLLIQAYARRRVRQALATVRKDELAALRADQSERPRNESIELSRRLAVLEQIVTDDPRALAAQIEGLRRETI